MRVLNRDRLRLLLAATLLCPSFLGAVDVRMPVGPAVEGGPAASAPELPGIPALPQPAIGGLDAPSVAVPGTPADEVAAPRAPAAPELGPQQLQSAAPEAAEPGAASGGESEKAGADQAFDNAVSAPEGAFSPEAAGKATKGKAPATPAAKSSSKTAPAKKGGKRPSTGKRKEPDPPGPNADDGGGPDYPYRSIRALGKTFRSVYFRPNVPVEPEIIRAIDSARDSVHIALYEFKLTGVLDALRRARDRGVQIHIVLDYTQVFPMAEPGADYKPLRSREIWALLREGFDVKVLKGFSEFGINHNKFAVIDAERSDALAIFGSYNWSYSAEHSHYENANFSNDKRRIKEFMQYWSWLDSMAQPEASAREYAWPQSLPAPPITIDESIDFNGITLPPTVFSPNSTPGHSIEDRLVQAIDASRRSIDISMFALRSTRIAEALARAHNDPKRNVKVRLIMDEGQSKSEPFGPYAAWLAAQGVEIRVLAGPDPDSKFPLAQKNHHKFAIFDGELVETGSSNYTTYAARANFENGHFLDDARDVESYRWIYEKNFARAKPYVAPGVTPALPTEAELEAELQKPPRPLPPPPPPVEPLPVQARDIPFRGKVFPSFAFRPDTPIEPLVVQAIDSASKSVRMAVYEFNLPEVLDALRRAKKRGLNVQLVVDHSHVYTRGKDHTGQPRMPSPQIQALINEGFDVLTLKGQGSGIMHNKYLLVDAEEAESLAMFGSYNFAVTAERNHYENVRFSNDKHDAADYLAYFDYKRGLASPIDHDKLEATLNRLNDADLSPEDAEIEAAAPADDDETAGDLDGARTSKFPPPPESTAPEIQFNGQTFKRRYFSPQGGILKAWLRAIDAAEESIDVAMFGFYSHEIADALVAKAAELAKQGKTGAIRLTLDAGQSSLPNARRDGINLAQWFAARGIEVRIKAGPNEDGDPMFEKQHNKYMLVDGKLLLTGSFNASDTAENSNFENENLTMDVTDVAGYAEYFVRRLFGTGWAPRGAPAPAAPAPGA